MKPVDAKILCYRNIGELIQVESCAPARIRRKTKCALVVKNGRVLKVVRDASVRPADYNHIIDLKGRSVIPGFVDCHTHLVFAGERKDEMEQRAKGADYLEIHRQGGGIHSTVKATRQAPEQELFRDARQRMQRMIALGTTAFEIKSGYGLDLETEKKILRVGNRLRDACRVPITLTYMGAHAVPTGKQREAYLSFVIEHLPEFRALADGVDIFCELDAFSVADLRRLFLQAKLLGFQLRAHVEELSHQGGCFEAAKLGAISCDHLEHALPHDIRAMKLAGTTAVLMPGVTLFLGGEKLPLVHTMLDSGVATALATDCNPGSCPTLNMQTVLYLAAHLYRLTPEQALASATLGGARALGQEKEFGGLLTGQRADFLVLKTADYRDLFYYFGDNFVAKTHLAGNPIG
jgi:imidazolonepropionase